MRINFSKLQLLPSQNISRPEVEYPYFLPLSPYGLDTGSVEALSSYLCRQAEDIMEMSHPYGQRLLEIYADPKTLPETRKFPAKGLHGCNGIGKVAERYIAATNTAANGSINAHYLTLRPLKHLCDSVARGLQRQFRAWCDECWKDDVQTEQTPHIRLYWLLQGTKCCVIHNRRLSEYCPACGEIQMQYPFHPRQWICDKCGFTLYKNDNEDLVENFTPEQGWASHAIYHLIDRVYSNKIEIDENCVVNAIRRTLKTAKLSLDEFAARLSVCPKMLRKLVTKEKKPFFPALLDLCFRMDIPLDQFLLDGDVLTSPDLWRNMDKPFFYASGHIHDKKRERIRKQLQKLIQDNPSPAVRVSHLATEFGVSYTALCYNFPSEYKLLRDRYLKWERKQRTSANTDRLQNVTDAAFGLVRHGVYPSDRKLRDLGYVLPSDLRREDVICILRSIQSVYSDLNVA